MFFSVCYLTRHLVYIKSNNKKFHENTKQKCKLKKKSIIQITEKVLRPIIYNLSLKFIYNYTAAKVKSILITICHRKAKSIGDI